MKRIFLIMSVFVMAAVSFSAVSFAEGDAVKGKKVFKKCKACHTVDQGGKNLVGPNLFGIVGKESAKKEGYKYSKAMRASGLTWDEATLDTYLKKPRALVKKTKMTFVGLKKEKHRVNVIAYLKTLQ
ncbi:MAG: cytochrome c family protein [Emcibacter sp.]|nr:cytochrome c family protein [Emcibacter sp.]